MAIPVTCTCGQAYRLSDELAGKRVRCKRCSAVLAVPASSAAMGANEAAVIPKPSRVATPGPRPLQPSSQGTPKPKRADPDPPPVVEAVIAEPAEEKKPRRKKKRKRSLEERIRRAEEDDYDEGHPWRVLGFIGFALLMAALAFYFYWDLSRFEEEGGVRRLNRIVWVAYQVGGVWGPVLLCGALSAAGAVLAVLNLIGVRVAVDLSSDD